jgi:hypothetical protein
MRSASPTLDPVTTRKGFGGCENDGQDQAAGEYFLFAVRETCRRRGYSGSIVVTCPSTPKASEDELQQRMSRISTGR